MTISTGQRKTGACFTRRTFLGALLGVALLGFGASDAAAQARHRPRRRQRFLQQRRIRRRAIRRFQQRDRQTHEEAREAVRRGEIRPLRDVFSMVRERAAGEVLDVDLHRRTEGWVYIVRVLTVRDRVRDVMLDAKTLQVLEIR